MNILIAGASGFIGTELANHLSKNHKITILGRTLKKLESIFSQDISEDSFDEDSPLPESSADFLQHIGLLWERSLNSAIETGIPVTTLRFGVVLKQGEGMLKKLELPFRFGLGSVLGSGNQTLSWIYFKDLINAIDFLITHQEFTGPVNITSPYPVTQQEFAQELAKALRRPLFLKTPGLIIKTLFGEMGDYLLLKGQRVLPKRLNELGFKFTYPKLESVLVEEFHKETIHKDK